MTTLFNGFPTAFFPINEHEDKCDVAAGFFDRVDCLER